VAQFATPGTSSNTRQRIYLRAGRELSLAGKNLVRVAKEILA